MPCGKVVSAAGKREKLKSCCCSCIVRNNGFQSDPGAWTGIATMKVVDMKDNAGSSGGGESILGFQHTGSHACYMIYGVLGPHEKGRRISPGAGHEEIVLALRGALFVTGAHEGTLQEGSAFHISGAQECYLENPGPHEAVYIIAGGHSADGHH